MANSEISSDEERLSIYASSRERHADLDEEMRHVVLRFYARLDTKGIIAPKLAIAFYGAIIAWACQKLQEMDVDAEEALTRAMAQAKRWNRN
jgi:hypothetical protein